MSEITLRAVQVAMNQPCNSEAATDYVNPRIQRLRRQDRHMRRHDHQWNTTWNRLWNIYMRKPNAIKDFPDPMKITSTAITDIGFVTKSYLETSEGFAERILKT
jgi:hypothetical protein